MYVVRNLIDYTDEVMRQGGTRSALVKAASVLVAAIELLDLENDAVSRNSDEGLNGEVS